MSERLNEQVESQADLAADLMRSTLQTFEADCTTSLSAAQTIIESDIAKLLARSAQLKKAVQPIWHSAAIASLILVVVILAASWALTSLMMERAQSSDLRHMGLQINKTENGTILTWDKSRVRLIECHTGSVSVSCLQVLERR